MHTYLDKFITVKTNWHDKWYDHQSPANPSKSSNPLCKLLKRLTPSNCLLILNHHLPKKLKDKLYPQENPLLSRKNTFLNSSRVKLCPNTTVKRIARSLLETVTRELGIGLFYAGIKKLSKNPQ